MMAMCFTAQRQVSLVAAVTRARIPRSKRRIGQLYNYTFVVEEDRGVRDLFIRFLWDLLLNVVINTDLAAVHYLHCREGGSLPMIMRFIWIFNEPPFEACERVSSMRKKDRRLGSMYCSFRRLPSAPQFAPGSLRICIAITAMELWRK